MFQAIELPYPLTGLEPYYNKKTLDIHYHTLYKGYIKNLNLTEEKLALAREKNDYAQIKCLEKDLSFNGSGVILHELFFLNMAPVNTSQPSNALANQILKDFGNFSNFKQQFISASKVIEGSGWSLLVWLPNFHKLEVLQCEKHQNLTLWGCVPLFVFDMWEHSYFLQYTSDKDAYIKAFWNIINWNVINSRYDKICF